MNYLYKYQTPIGNLAIEASSEAITGIYFLDKEKIEESSFIMEETAIIKKAILELNEYFAKKRTSFSVKLAPHGTNFQKNVWAALLQIPYGKTCSYKDVAVAVNSAKAYRAVGLANNKNPIPIIVPCHRVIGANKKLVGYGGGLEIKEYLLKLEGAI